MLDLEGYREKQTKVYGKVFLDDFVGKVERQEC